VQVRFSFVHLIAYDITVKIKFKMDIIWVRLIILKSLYYARLCGRWCSGDFAADVNHLHVKRIHLVSFIYSYRGYISVKKCDVWWGDFLEFKNYFSMEKCNMAWGDVTYSLSFQNYFSRERWCGMWWFSWIFRIIFQ
jgi:hypothetical protein